MPIPDSPIIPTWRVVMDIKCAARLCKETVAKRHDERRDIHDILYNTSEKLAVPSDNGYRGHLGFYLPASRRGGKWSAKEL